MIHDPQHETQTLQHCAAGYVLYCPACNRYQVAFGNVCLTQELDQLRSFAGLVSKNVKRFRYRRARKQRDIYIDSPYSGFSLVFSLVDLQALDGLLRRSLLLVDAQHHIRLS